MQYNHYSSATHQVHSASHPSQSSDDYASSYPDPSHNHSTLSYATVTPSSHFPAGSMTHQNIAPQYSFSSYNAHNGSPDDHRSYYATSSQAPPVEHYPTPSTPTGSYTAGNTSSHLSSQASRHHSHHHSQQPAQQQFIPTPSQAYQVYSSGGSSTRSRSTVEPYYHMSPNPQHATHGSPPLTHTSGGTGGRSSATHRNSSSHTHGHTHTGTIVAAAGERYPCDLCDRSFTRLHDRRRHYETVHATSPVSHTCRFCQKGFSRSDSLKRHVDNGCDDMPR